MCTCLLRPVLDPLRARVRGGCKPPDKGAGNGPWVLWVSSTMLLTDKSSFQSLTYCRTLISILSCSFLLLSLSPKVCSSVMTVVKQLWVLPENRLATHVKWRVFLAMGGNEDCRKGVQVDGAGFFSLRLIVKRQCQERPLFVAET